MPTPQVAGSEYRLRKPRSFPKENCANDGQALGSDQQNNPPDWKFAVTEREWQRLETTMNSIVEQQAKFEARMEADSAKYERQVAALDKRFAAAERRTNRLEDFADRTLKAGKRRRAKA